MQIAALFLTGVRAAPAAVSRVKVTLTRGHLHGTGFAFSVFRVEPSADPLVYRSNITYRTNIINTVRILSEEIATRYTRDVKRGRRLGAASSSFILVGGC